MTFLRLRFGRRQEADPAVDAYESDAPDQEQPKPPVPIIKKVRRLKIVPPDAGEYKLAGSCSTGTLHIVRPMRPAPDHHAPDTR